MSEIIFYLEFEGNSKYGVKNYVEGFIRTLEPNFQISRPKIGKPWKNESKVEAVFTIDLGSSSKEEAVFTTMAIAAKLENGNWTTHLNNYEDDKFYFVIYLDKRGESEILNSATVELQIT